MPRRQFPNDVIKQAQGVVNGWNQIAPVPAFGALTAASLNTDVTTATALETQIAALEAQLADKRAGRDAQFNNLWDKVKRARNSIKGSFGDDSSQYKMVGGTRLSDRKSPRRSAPPAQQA
jgi:hypothetical protein